MEGKINVAMFCQNLPEIALKNLQLRPQKTLEFCVHPQPESKTVSSIDPRYLENDSRYITPEDMEKYRIEFENLMKERDEKFASQELSPKMPRRINVTYENNFSERQQYESEDEDESDDDDDDYEEENLEYEYRSK